MKTFQAGNGSIYAEIIIDFKKKTTQILDPESRFKIKNSDMNFVFTPYIVFLLIGIFAVSIYFNRLYEYAIISLAITSCYYISILARPITLKYHHLGQFLFNDYFKVKKYVSIKNLKTNYWKLKHPFKGIKADFILHKDYKKYVDKIHIIPKDYYHVRGSDSDSIKAKEKQQAEWDIFVYFSRVPKIGKMEVIFI